MGLLEGKHVELIQGEILTRTPIGEPHALTIMQLNYALLPHFNPRTDFHLWIQMPLALPALTCEPEPDIAMAALETPTNEANRPISAALVVEAAESSLAYDRDRKGPLYAAAGIQEYELVDVPERCLEVYRQPVPDTCATQIKPLRQVINDEGLGLEGILGRMVIVASERMLITVASRSKTNSCG